MEQEQSEFCYLKALQCSELASNLAAKKTRKETETLCALIPTDQRIINSEHEHTGCLLYVKLNLHIDRSSKYSLSVSFNTV